MVIKARKLEWKALPGVPTGLQADAPDGTLYRVWEYPDRTPRWCWFWKPYPEAAADCIFANTLEAAQSDAQHHWNERCISFLDPERLNKVTLAYQHCSDVVLFMSTRMDQVLAAREATIAVDTDVVGDTEPIPAGNHAVVAQPGSRESTPIVSEHPAEPPAQERLNHDLGNLLLNAKTWWAVVEADSCIRQLSWNMVRNLAEAHGRMTVCEELGITLGDLDELITTDWTKSDVPAQLLEQYLEEWEKRR